MTYELKTKRNDGSVDAYLDTVTNEKRRNDSLSVMEIMGRVTGLEPKLWGKSLIGFGSYHYKYKSGQEGEWPITAVAPRKQALSVYIMPGFKACGDLMKKLGKYKTGVSCLYVKRLEDVEIVVLEELIARSVADMRRLYPEDANRKG